MPPSLSLRYNRVNSRDLPFPITPQPGWVNFGRDKNWLMLRGVPVLPLSTPSNSIELAPDAEVGWVRMLAPRDFQPVLPGHRDSDCSGLDFGLLEEADLRFLPAHTTCFDQRRNQAPVVTHDFTTHIIERVEHLETVTLDHGGVQTRLEVWRDSGIDSEVRSAVESFVLGGMSTSMAADLAFAIDHVGNGENGATGTVERYVDAAVVFASAAYGESELGLTGGGSILLFPAEASGSKYTSDEFGGAAAIDVLSNVFTHEATHLLMRRRTWDRETDWMEEAVPELVALMRQPGVGSMTLFDGLYYRVRAFLEEDNTQLRAHRNLEDNPVTILAPIADRRRYHIGPYLLAQAIVARHGDDPPPAFANLRQGLLESGELWEPVSRGELRGFFDLFLGAGPGAFYNQRVQGYRYGEPLLGIEDYDLADGGDGRSVTIEQQQRSLISDRETEFQIVTTGIPYALACITLDGQQVYGQCQGGSTGVSSVATLAAFSERLTLTPEAWIDVDTSDTAVRASAQVTRTALYTNHMLLPGHIGFYHVTHRGDLPSASLTIDDPIAPTWTLSCRRGRGSYPDCLIDGDSDGYPLEGDCNDTDVTIHPDQADPDTGLWEPGDPDRNCDGWPVDFWR